MPKGTKIFSTKHDYFVNLLISQIRLRVGEYDFSSVLEPYPYVEKKAKKKVVHPNYNFFTYEYDLALVEMESEIQFQPHIQPICLPGNQDLLIGEIAKVTGWGRLSEHGTLPSILQQTSVPIMSNAKCQELFLKGGRKEHIPDIFLCAGYEKGGRDSCQAKSQKEESNKHTDQETEKEKTKKQNEKQQTYRQTNRQRN
ncbi:Serine proteinase stubble [Armadillidium nasatum]|uniref:Serine proteinase stubble n=1 Tax=Armadillidium nasatum TaxID=96803 RepID=A0A5N5SZT2_9CRUS|nr:Serine proteinase stubble [Armadillidium nasatum]